MSNPDWQQVRALFEQALAVPPDQREMVLADAAGHDAAVLERVRALLRSHEEAAHFLERPPTVAAVDPFALPDLSGVRLGPYLLETRIGIGGMGQVYRARDTRLQRTVAIKVLSSSIADAPRRERFEIEARAVAALTHPDICTLYDVGTEDTADGRRIHYLVMEFLDGETLADRLARGGMTIGEALDHAKHIADALDCAHRAGIVHRDLKPGNIMLVPSGAKLLDFGLAKTAAVIAQWSPIPDGPSLTAPGTILGTLHYMAPEQLEGLPTDARADLFALGCVLYEMVTGRRPFEGRSPAGLLTAIMASHPAPVRAYAPDAPAELEHIITTCLHKDAGQRWQSARELRIALQQLGDRPRIQAPHAWIRNLLGRRATRLAAVAAACLVTAAAIWMGASRQPRQPQLAVLPLRWVGGAAAGAEYLGIAIADSIITQLAAVHQIGLRPTTAVLKLGGDPSLRHAAEVLAVDHVLTGTIRSSGSTYVVTLQLVRKDDMISWTRRYDFAAGNLLSLPDTIAEEVVGALRVELTPTERERLRERRPAKDGSYELYLRGRASLVQYSEAGMNTAIDAFERAITIDPQFGLAHAGLAVACAWFSIRYAYETDALRWGARADAEARAALASDPSSAEAMLAIASAAGTLYGGFDWPRVIDGANRALAIDPTLDLGHVVLMRAFFHLGLFDRMAEEAAASRRLDPLGNVEIARLEVAASLFSGSFQRAREQATALLGRSDVPAVRTYLGLAQFYTDDIAAARETLAGVRRGGKPDVRSQAALAGVEAAGKDKVAARQLALVIEQGPYMDHHVASSLAGAWAQLGEPAAAVKWLQRAADTGFPSYPWVARDPMLDPIRSSAEFVAFIEGLKERYQREIVRYGRAS